MQVGIEGARSVLFTCLGEICGANEAACWLCVFLVWSDACTVVRLTLTVLCPVY